MKTKLATALSLVGVLGAGSAAALVNTQILDSGPTESGASAAVLPPPSSVDLTVPTIPVDALTDNPTDTSTTTTLATATSATSTTEPSSTSTTVAPVASGMLTAFNVGDAGVVTVEVIDGRLVLVAAEPKPGWELTEAHDGRDDDLDDDDSGDDDSDDGDESEVEVEFRSATVRVEFEASLVDGQIVPRVESKAIGGTTSRPGATSNTVPSTTIDDDDHDDDRDEDENDEDERDEDDRDEDDDHEDEPHDDDEDEDEPDDD